MNKEFSHLFPDKALLASCRVRARPGGPVRKFSRRTPTSDLLSLSLYSFALCYKFVYNKREIPFFFFFFVCFLVVQIYLGK